MRWNDAPSAAAAAAFAVVARSRGARAFHPVGRAYEATLHIAGDGAPHPFWSGSHHAVVRLSRGAGLPSRLPDVLGLAVKLPDHLGPGRDQDLLLASAGGSGLLQSLLRPARHFTKVTFSSILPYSTEEGLVVFGARALPELRAAESSRTADIERLAADGTLAFRLLFAPLARNWDEAGTLRVHGGIPQQVADALRFDPWHTHHDLRPAGPLNGVRAAAYAGSRTGRGRAGASTSNAHLGDGSGAPGVTRRSPSP